MADSSLRPRPLRIEPQFVPRIWGTKSLAPLFPDAGPSGPVGEIWLTGNDCIVADPPFAGQTLANAWQAMPQSWAGARVGRDGPFPILAKFLFPEQKLSVQVHPNDEYARAHEAAKGGIGKTEMWYAISAENDAHVYVGLSDGVTPQKLRERIEEGSVERCLRRIDVKAGDAIFVPAGTVHTIGPEMVLCEIQENSDITYRIFDYGRRNPDGSARDLHVEQALAVTNFGAQRGGKVQPVRRAQGCCEIVHYVACPYFAVERYRFTAALKMAVNPQSIELFVVMEGSGAITSNGTSAEYRPGQLWLIPACLGTWSFEPSANTTVLRAFVPDLAAYKLDLIDAGIPISAISGVVHP